MTPTEQDKELRDKIADLFDELCEPTNKFWHRDSGLYWASKVMQLITADRKRVALEARIDELENRLRVQFIPSHWERLCAEVNSWAKYVDRRIAELKAQQEEV